MMTMTKTPAAESRLALTRWYAGSGTRLPQSPRWYGAVAGRLAVALRGASAAEYGEVSRALERAIDCFRAARG